MGLLFGRAIYSMAAVNGLKPVIKRMDLFNHKIQSFAINNLNKFLLFHFSSQHFMTQSAYNQYLVDNSI